MAQIYFGVILSWRHIINEKNSETTEKTTENGNDTHTQNEKKSERDRKQE